MNKLMKFPKVILTIVIMLCVALPTLAHDFEVRGIYYNYLDKTAKTVMVTYRGNNYYDYSNEYTGSVTIPSSVTYSGTTYSVTEIDYSAFYECYGLTSITIPNSVTSIGYMAFYYCTGLTSITIPNSVTEIGDRAFSGCDGLTEVNISDLSAWCKIYFSNPGANPLYSAEKLKLNGSEIKDLVIPNDVTEIKNYAFRNCSGLTSITIPNSVTSIGESAFSSCTGLTSVNYNAENCTSMGSSSFPVFSGCSKLKTLNIGNKVKTIPSYAFHSCTGLTSITIPNSVTEIGFYAFSSCSGLTSVTIGNSVTSIGNYTFSSCSGLTSITIPNSVTEIGSFAFSHCSGLTEVNISDLSAWCKIDFGSSDANPLYYAKKFKLNGAEIKDLVIPNDITKIKDYAFSSCTGLTSITIPNSVTSIGDYAFSSCTGLTELIIEDGKETLSLGHNYYSNSSYSTGEGLFYDCPLEKLYLGRNLNYESGQSYGYSPFYSKTKLKEVTIGKSVTKIGNSAFINCTKVRL